MSEAPVLLREIAPPLADAVSWWRYLASAEPEVLRAILRRPAATPVARVRVGRPEGDVDLFLKLENYNITGSSKDRTARGMVNDLLVQGRLQPGDEIVESTSGNLGVALTLAARAYGFTFRAVVDPTLSPRAGALMTMLGARIEVVSEADASGGFLNARLARVAQLCAEDPTRVWSNQYESLANVEAHYHGTAKELFDQLQEPVDLVVAPISTGGTLAGVGRRARECHPTTGVVAADSVGSVALGGVPRPRLLTGIGSGRRSRLLDVIDIDDRVLVSDVLAVSLCRLLADRLGLRLGGSSGAAVAACLIAAGERGVSTVACICPDGGDRYGHSVYDEGWRLRHGLDQPSIELPDELSFVGWIAAPWTLMEGWEDGSDA